MATKLYALHGFLGLPCDWDFLIGISDVDFHAADLYSKSHLSLDAFATNLNQEASCNPSPSVLLGYSLGGRLALHAMCQNPTLWRGALIVSAHPGLTREQERITRKQKDKDWSDRFMTEDWRSLMHAWNEQLAFKNTKPINRNEIDYQRESLSQALENWSLGNQKNLSLFLHKSQIPTLWIVGDADHQYCQLSKSISFSHQKSRVWIAPKAGHRVPFDQPHLLKNEIQKFIGEI